jgi:hypothetical protein
MMVMMRLCWCSLMPLPLRSCLFWADILSAQSVMIQCNREMSPEMVIVIQRSHFSSILLFWLII